MKLRPAEVWMNRVTRPEKPPVYVTKNGNGKVIRELIA
jgi:hypothetical protein